MAIDLIVLLFNALYSFLRQKSQINGFLLLLFVL